MINYKSRIFVAGHKGLVGSAILRILREKGYKNIITIDKKKLNLTDKKKVLNFFKKKKPDVIFLAAAKVGGIYSNQKYKADFIYDNLTIQVNVIDSAHKCNVKDLIFLGSSCVYPRDCKQPIKEEYLLNGKLEKTNDAYAIAKIAGIKMCQSYNQQHKRNYRCIMPTNTYGQNDNYDDLNSHFIPALIKKLHKLKKFKKNELKLWGDGSPKREVIYVNDLARACVYFMKKKTKEDIINIGTGIDYSIKDYANILSKVILPNKKIKIKFDRSKPNGTPRKVLDISLAKKYGWKPESNLKQSILETYEFFLKENASKYN
jgi:GDP-L-fucose synthase